MRHLYLDRVECLYIVICHLLVSNHTTHVSHYPSGAVETPHCYPENVYLHPTIVLENSHVDMQGPVGPIPKGNECLVTTLDKLVGD